jgi:hypothetical protein
VRIIPLPVPVGLREHVFVIKAVSEQLQNVDWDTPPKFNVERIPAASAVRG